MDNHADLLIKYVKLSLDSCISKIKKDHPKYNDIKKGKKIIWNKYYKLADDGTELLSSVVKRINNDIGNNSENAKYILAFTDIFGKLILFTK